MTTFVPCIEINTMVYDLQTLILIEVDTMAVIANAVCCALLWLHRRNVASRSSIILISICMALLFLFATKVTVLISHGLDNSFVEFHSWKDLYNHIWETNVLLRITFVLTITLDLPLLWIAYQATKSSLPIKWMIICLAIANAVLLIIWFFTLSTFVQIIHNLELTVCVACITYFEINKPIFSSEISPSLTLTPLEQTNKVSSPFVNELWIRIIKVLHDDSIWCNPDLSLEMFCKLVGSNKDYINKSFHVNANTTFSDYVNRLRIERMAEELCKNPLVNKKELFLSVGYRSRTSAWRNFQKYMGVSPTDYISSCNKNISC